MRFFPFAIVLIVISVLALTGCASEQDNARKTADQFLTALERGDRAAVEKYLTPVARQKGAMGASDFAPSHSDDKDARHSVGTPTLNGNEASIPITLTGKGDNQDARIYLRKEENAWGVYALGMPIGPGGPEIKVDFENPEKTITESFRAVGQGLGQVFKGIEQGMGEFQKGFEEGYGKPISTPTPNEKGEITETK